MDIVITGIGLTSSLGDTLEDSWHNLLAKKSGIKVHQPFVELEPLPFGIIGNRPASLSNLTYQVTLSALQDARLIPPLPECGVVIGSSRGYQASWEQLASSFTSPLIKNWLNTLPNMNAIAVARQIGATGIVLSPMAACATGIWAIAQATQLIQSGQCQRVMVGATEAPITPLSITGFKQMGALAKTGVYPFDINRQGLALAEGGAVFVLESLELAWQRQAKIYGQILGFGLTCDAYHGSKPDYGGKSAIAAIEQCLNRADLCPADIDYIHAHGTATQINDSVENSIIQSIFPQDVAVSSTKGATGHTLGASGVLGMAFCLMALQHQILPPCVGLSQPEFDLNFVTQARESKIRRSLCLSFGFGGQNAVVVLGKKNDLKQC